MSKFNRERKQKNRRQMRSAQKNRDFAYNYGRDLHKEFALWFKRQEPKQFSLPVKEESHGRIWPTR